MTSREFSSENSIHFNSRLIQQKSKQIQLYSDLI